MQSQAMPMFHKVLVANRGEIACRIMRSATALGIRTVAVYSEADREARHVQLADEAVCIGPAAALESYLSVDRILAAAAQTKVDAIHPGYGFLAENGGFAEACVERGFRFIGPPAAAIRAMGDKRLARQYMAAAGVPVTPGYDGADQGVQTLLHEAEKIGYPVLIKAAAGGGGKGMRVVESATDFSSALDSTRREALAAFSDDSVLLEKYVSRPRHVEVQIFCDQQGNAVHLYERDCSIQRRHQKIIEEAPAPGLPPALRQELGATALQAARAVDYEGAGTVEFLLTEDLSFYFMEMNTRLQVEHPVTELVTGQDLVAWQFQVAAGACLPRSQDEIRVSGHAIEARLCAEDPARDFAPATGSLHCVEFPGPGGGIRIDHGIRSGDTVTPWYDPMIAKVIAHGTDREQARNRLANALRETCIDGPATNTDYLVRILECDAFEAAELSTHFLAEQSISGAPPKPADSGLHVAFAALFEHLERAAARAGTARYSADPFSPWNRVSGWRLNRKPFHRIELGLEGTTRVVRIEEAGTEYRVETGGKPVTVRNLKREDNRMHAEIDGTLHRAIVSAAECSILVRLRGVSQRFDFHDPELDEVDETRIETGCSAPMTGNVIQVLVVPGQQVSENQPLIIMEAMKMEHVLRAPRDAQVEAVYAEVGNIVSDGEELLLLTPPEPE